MSSLFSTPRTQASVAYSPAPAKSDAEVQSDTAAARQRQAAATGRSSTILTGADSTTGTRQKTLLGE